MPTHDEALRALNRVRCSGMQNVDSLEAVATIRAYIEQAKADAVDADRRIKELERAIAARSAKPGETR